MRRVKPLNSPLPLNSLMSLRNNLVCEMDSYNSVPKFLTVQLYSLTLETPKGWQAEENACQCERQWNCYWKGDSFQGLRVGSCLILRNELSEETHVLIKQKTLLGRGAQGESRRVREPRRTALPRGSQSQVLW